MRFSRSRWPESGPVLELLSYLDTVHAEAGRPSLAEMGREVALAPSTLSGFFTGARLIGRGNLELLVEHLGGDVTHAESLRRRAVQAWTAPAKDPAPKDPAHKDPAHKDPDPALKDSALKAQPKAPLGEGEGRLEIVLYDAPVNKLNRPEQLFGRDDLMATVTGLLKRGDRVLLHGMAGAGKTALAATLADRWVESGGGSYLWLRPGVADPDLVLDALAHGLASGSGSRAPDTVGDGRFLALQNLVTRLEVGLCVIDDAWPAQALYTLLRAMPAGLPVLVTSRLKLGLDHGFEVAGLRPADALNLLTLHARDDRLGDQEARALCADLGHHPYAIEIAGHHLRQYACTARELRAQIASAPHTLAMPGGFAAEGRESIKRLLDNTFAALDGDEAAAAVLRAFGAFPSPGATIDLLAGYLGSDTERLLGALNVLVDLSLAKRLPHSRFYAIHDLTHSYARALPGGGDPHRTVSAVAGFVRHHRSDHDLLEMEMSNVVGVATRARGTDPDRFLAIVEDLAGGGYLDRKGHAFGVLRLLADAIALLGDAGETGRQHTLLSKQGNALFHRGELELAIDSYREALSFAPNDSRRVVLLSVLGKVLSVLGKHDEAEQLFTRAYALADSTADDQARLHVLEQHNVAAFAQRDYVRVRELTQRGIELARAQGAQRFEAFFLNNLGTAEFELGVIAAAERHGQAQAIALATGDDHLLALTHHTLGIDRHAQENAAMARQHLDEALRLYEKLGQTNRQGSLGRMMREFGYLNQVGIACERCVGH
jgi:tetratricopeptide (TPR) repeat protein